MIQKQPEKGSNSKLSQVAVKCYTLGTIYSYGIVVLPFLPSLTPVDCWTAGLGTDGSADTVLKKQKQKQLKVLRRK